MAATIRHKAFVSTGIFTVGSSNTQGWNDRPLPRRETPPRRGQKSTVTTEILSDSAARMKTLLSNFSMNLNSTYRIRGIGA
jgi:hypothetical protein